MLYLLFARKTRRKKPSGFLSQKPGALFALLVLSQALTQYLAGGLIAVWAGDKIAEFSFPEISFHFPLHPCFFFVSPAYAGKSWPGYTAPCRFRDHPRVCGEKQKSVRRRRWDSGSPPRMRGKEGLVRRRGHRVGITPAYAGKSRSGSGSAHRRWDHPRACGEKLATMQ